MQEMNQEALSQLELLSNQPIEGEVLSKSDLNEQRQQNSRSQGFQSRSEGSLAEPTELELSRVQKFIQEKLVEKGYSADVILEEMIDIASTGMLPNPVT